MKFLKGLGGSSTPPQIPKARQTMDLTNLRNTITFCMFFDFQFRNLKNLITFCLFFDTRSPKQ